MDIKEQTDAFLRSYGMQPETIDVDACARAFVTEMENGLSGEPSSLMMLPTYLTTGRVPTGEQAVAIDAGGTNFRVALVRFESDGPLILEQYKSLMPGTGEQTTKEQFLEAVAARLAPVIDWSDRIGFCFSFPAEIRPNRDACVIRFNKEIKITGAEGMLLCDALAAYLPAGKRFTVLNDTAAAILSGAGRAGEEPSIGFVLGTGTNTCYPERADNIKTLRVGGSGTMLVNTESAGFNGFPLGVFDRRFDRSCAIPGDHLFEKLVSGGYQGGIIRETVLQASLDGLLSKGFLKIPAFDMMAVSAFIKDPGEGGLLTQLCTGEKDRGALYQICERSLERAARLIAANLAGILEKGDFGRNAPARIVAEGSTFWGSNLYRSKITETLGAHLRESGRRFEIVKIQDAALVGAAAAAILN